MRLCQVLVCESGHLLAHRLQLDRSDTSWLLRHVTSPRDCIKRLPTGSPAIVVLSIAEQLDPGLELLAWLQLHRPRVRVIVVTSSTAPNELSELCWSLGACLVLSTNGVKDVPRTIQTLIAATESEF